MVSPRPTHLRVLETPIHDAGVLFADFEDERRKWPIWVAVILLALLCHLLVSLCHLDWSAPTAPLQVEINPVNPAKLDAIRKQWQREKGILIDRDKNRPSDTTKPKDARYFSDKNIQVEHEQRARQTNVLPKVGAPGPRAHSNAQEKPKSVPKIQSPPTALPNLGTLGVPLHLNRKAVPKTDPGKSDPQPNSGDEGGDQAVADKDLPQGSENMLNAEESVFYSFYSRMYEAIAPVWQSRIREVANSQRVAAGDYTTVVDVVLDRNGNLIGVRQVHGSGVEVFDRAVNEALSKTPRFPNPPKDLLNASGEVHTGWTFTVSLDQATGGYNFLPPERVY